MSRLRAKLNISLASVDVVSRRVSTVRNDELLPHFAKLVGDNEPMLHPMEGGIRGPLPGLTREATHSRLSSMVCAGVLGRVAAHVRVDTLGMGMQLRQGWRGACRRLFLPHVPFLPSSHRQIHRPL